MQPARPNLGPRPGPRSTSNSSDAPDQPRKPWGVGKDARASAKRFAKIINLKPPCPSIRRRSSAAPGRARRRAADHARAARRRRLRSHWPIGRASASSSTVQASGTFLALRYQRITSTIGAPVFGSVACRTLPVISTDNWPVAPHSKPQIAAPMLPGSCRSIWSRRP